jgi:hypothetical protein
MDENVDKRIVDALERIADVLARMDNTLAAVATMIVNDEPITIKERR